MCVSCGLVQSRAGEQRIVNSQQAASIMKRFREMVYTLREPYRFEQHFLDMTLEEIYLDLQKALGLESAEVSVPSLRALLCGHAEMASVQHTYRASVPLVKLLMPD